MLSLRKILAVIILFVLFSCKESDKEEIRLQKTFYLPKIDFNPRHYFCYKTEENLKIDGVIDEKSWQNAAWTEKFIDIEGDKKPLHDTRVKMLWSEDYLYVFAELNEPHINASLRQRDTVVFYDNDFEIFIDPDGDTHNYFELEINAFNTVWDLFMVKPYRDWGPSINGWNISGLKTAVKCYGSINNPIDIDEKWTVEIAIPMHTLIETNKRFLPAGNIWRINFSRVQWQYEVINGIYKKKTDPETSKKLAEYNWVWSPQGVINMHYPEMWGFLIFKDKLNENEKEVFSLSEDEKLKWELRKLYYAQQLFYRKNGKYTSQLPQLQKLGLHIDNQKHKFKIEAVGTLFKASIRQDDSFWNIDYQGKTWKSKIRKK